MIYQVAYMQSQRLKRSWILLDVIYIGVCMISTIDKCSIVVLMLIVRYIRNPITSLIVLPSDL